MTMLDNAYNQSVLQYKKCDVLDSFIHYSFCGHGDPIVFIHGVPTSSYLWRHIMPRCADSGYCIAPDLIGMGDSGKPDIEYRIFDFIRYFEAFMERLNLNNITLVLHGWGSVVGFAYAAKHPDKIKSLVFYESHVRPIKCWNELSLPVQEFAATLKDSEKVYDAIIEHNYFIDRVLPVGAVEELSEEVMNHYKSPYKTPASRLPIWQYILDLPLGDGPEDVVNLIASYSKWLSMSSVPKLMLYGIPGFVTTIDTVQWTKQHFPNLWLAELDDVLHFAPETAPNMFSEKFLTWYKSI